MPRKNNKQLGYFDPFPTRLREIMEEQCETQQAIADALGKESRQVIGNYANAVSSPDMRTLVDLAKHFNVSTDWLLGLSEYRGYSDRELTLDKMGFSEAATSQLASIAGSVPAADELGPESKKTYSPVANPNQYTIQEETRAFRALNTLLEHPEIVRALSNAWGYMEYSGQFDPKETMKIGGEELPEPFSAPCGVLIDALWNRVAEPLRAILDEVAKNRSLSEQSK